MSLLGPQHRRLGERKRPEPVPELPEPFAHILSACTVMDPAERCTVQDIAQSLRSIPPSTAAPASAVLPPPVVEETAADVQEAEPEPEPRPAQVNRRQVAAMAIAGMTLLLLLFLVFSRRGAREPEPAPVAQKPAADTKTAPIPSPLDLPVGTQPLSTARTNTRGRAATEAEIVDLVDRWVSSFRSRDLNTHVSLYAPSVERFFLARNVSLSQVRRVKQQAVASAGEIRQYTVENIETDIDSPTRATVTFDKTFEFSGGAPRSGKVRGVLYLRRINENWRIVGERDTRVYWQRK
jgi:hypothetical protein